MNITARQIIEGILSLLLVGGMVVWFIVRTVRRAEDPAKMIGKWVITLPVGTLCLVAVPLFGPAGTFVIVFCAITLSILWTPHLAVTFIKPLTSAFDGGDLAPEPRPLYSIAQARQKQ